MGAHGIAEGAEDAAASCRRSSPSIPDAIARRRRRRGASLHRHGLDRAVLGDRLDLQAASRAGRSPGDARELTWMSPAPNDAGQAAARLDRNGLADGEAFVLVVAYRRAVVERAGRSWISVASVPPSATFSS